MRQAVINLIRGAVVKRGMIALIVVKSYPWLQAVTQLGAGAERMQVKVVVFDGPPKPFNEDVVLASAAAVHADSDFVVFENLGEAVAGKLGSLMLPMRSWVKPEGARPRFRWPNRCVRT